MNLFDPCFALYKVGAGAMEELSKGSRGDRRVAGIANSKQVGGGGMCCRAEVR